MITCDSRGEIIVNVGDKSYNLSIEKQYADFLLWVTTPSSAENVAPDLFTLDSKLPEEHHDKALRYSEFLSSYSERRAATIQEYETVLTPQQRRTKVEALLERLREADGRPSHD